MNTIEIRRSTVLADARRSSPAVVVHTGAAVIETGAAPWSGATSGPIAAGAGVGALAGAAVGWTVGLGLVIGAVAGGLVGAGVGYGMSRRRLDEAGPTKESIATPGETAAAPGKPSPEIREMAFPGPKREAYATETAEEARARELGENWGYSFAIYKACTYIQQGESPPNPSPPESPSTSVGYLPPDRVRWRVGGSSATAADVIKNHKSLGGIYDNAFDEAWRFGMEEAVRSDFDCGAASEILKPENP